MLFAERFAWEARTVYLLLSSASAFFFTTILTINLVYQLQVAHLNPLQLVLVGTVLEITMFLTQVPTGVLADVYSRRLAVIVGLVLTGAGSLLEGAIPQFWAILLSQVLWGLGVTCTDGADSAWIADEVGETQLGPLLLRSSQVSRVLTLLAIPLSVGLASVRLNLPVLLGGGLFVALALLLVGVMPERGFKPRAREDRSSWQAFAETTSSGIRLIRQRPILLTFLGITAFAGLFSEGYDRLWTAHLLEDFTVPTLGPFQPVVWFGVISAGSALLNLGVTEVIKRRLDLTHHRMVANLLFAFTACLVASILSFALAGNFWVALLAIWCASVFREVQEPVLRTWQVQRIDPAVRATVLSLDGQVNALGQIAGGPAVGAIGNRSLRAALVVAGAALSPALLLLLRARSQSTVALAPDEETPGIAIPLGTAATLNEGEAQIQIAHPEHVAGNAGSSAGS
jgi:DHA3 family tetracycline resistance protein-like MFS transporter